ncbi:MAG: YggT family protein [Betaproteobacteria bacterium]|nr:YggT family protein [Betaproteobacteria bacterium]
MLLDILNLLLEAGAGFFGYLLLLRFIMQWRRVSFANPLGQFVLQTTNWAVVPLRRVIPGILGLDFASLIPAWLLQVVVKLIMLGLKATVSLSAATLVPVALFMGAFEVVRMLVMMAIALMLAQAVISWINPHTPLAGPIRALTDPLLRPLRRLVPPIANIDLSPLLAVLLAQVVLMLLAYTKAALMPLLF